MKRVLNNDNLTRRKAFMIRNIKIMAIPLAFVSLFTLIFPAVTTAVLVGEYSTMPISMVSGKSSGLTADLDGNIWFAVQYGHQLGHITPAGEVTVFSLPPDGYLTGSIVAGPDGNIWYGTEFVGKVGRITPSGAITEFPLSMDSVSALAAGPDDNVWFSGSGGVIGRITPNGNIKKFQLSEGASAITTGPDGNLWFVQVAANKIGRMTTYGGLTMFTVPTANAQPFNITTGPDGNLWFIEINADKIGRISPAGIITEFSIPWPGCGAYGVIEPVGIIAGPDGKLWFTEHECDKIGRIAPNGTFLSELLTPSAFSGPQHITASPDGLLWFTESLNKIGVISQASISNYFPLNSGNSWTYEVTGSESITLTVAPGVTRINGIDTKLIQSSDGSRNYFTNDSDGIRLHRQYDPTPPSSTVTFQPPIKLADTQSMFGLPLTTCGTASGNIDGSPFSLAYCSYSTIQGLEKMTMPAGIFETARVQLEISIESASVVETYWVSENVGTVKEVFDTDTYLMKTTNILKTVPDPFWFRPQIQVNLRTLISSNSIVLSGITAPTTVSITGGDYSINSGPYTHGPGTVTNGQTVTVRQTSSSSPRTRTRATLTIGGIGAIFDVTTSDAQAMPWIPLLLLDD
jgi:streptogramin lyase